MRIERDAEHDLLYIELQEGNVERTVDLDDGAFMDLDADGRVLGLEFLSMAVFERYLAQHGGQIEIPEVVEDADASALLQQAPDSGPASPEAGEVNKAAEKFAEAVQESFRTVADRAVPAAQLNAELTENFFNSVIDNLRAQAESNPQTAQELRGPLQQQREIMEATTHQSLRDYMDFINSMFSYYQGSVEQAQRPAHTRPRDRSGS